MSVTARFGFFSIAVASAALLGAFFQFESGARAQGSAAAASATVTVGAATYDPAQGELELLLGVVRGDGTSAKLADARLLLDGAEAGPALALEPLAAYATDHPKWTPPIAMGLVYLWATGTPPALLDGIEALFRHLPLRLLVYPTPYGQGYRPLVAAVTASRVAGGDLGEYPPIPGDQPKLLDALRFNVQKLADEDAPLRELIVVTDGHDVAPADAAQARFAALGEEMRKRHIALEVVAFRPPGDLGEGMASLRSLVGAARGRLIDVERPSELAQSIESLAEPLLGLRRVRFGVPWVKRAFGGTRRAGVVVMADGAAARGEDGLVAIPRASGWLWAVSAIVLLLAAGLIAAFAGPLRELIGSGAGRQEAWPTEEDEEAQGALLDELCAHVRIGLPPERVLEELSIAFPDEVEGLLEVDVASLPSGRYRVLQTRAGQARLREVQDLLQGTIDEPTLDEEMAELLAEALAAQVAPPATAQRLRARVSSRRWSAFSRASQEDLGESLGQAAADFAILGRPDALPFALAVQEALCSGASVGPEAIGWLVRAMGPGLRGQTLRIGEGRTVVGGRESCSLRLEDDPAVVGEHAEIAQQGGEFCLTPLGGQVRVEGARVERQHVLVDGETVEIGQSRFVFKSVT